MSERTCGKSARSKPSDDTINAELLWLMFFIVATLPSVKDSTTWLPDTCKSCEIMMKRSFGFSGSLRPKMYDWPLEMSRSA